MLQEFTKTQLGAILGALDDKPRNPSSADTAKRAIAARAGKLGVAIDDVYATATALLEARISPAGFRAELQDMTAERSSGGESVDDLTDIPPIFKRKASAKRKAATPQRRAKRVWIMPKTAPKKPKRAKGVNGMPGKGTKQALLVEMLKRPDGATIEEIMDKTSWQAHSVRGAIAGTVKRKLGFTVLSSKAEGGARTYRIPA